MKKGSVLFPLAPVYKKKGIIFHQAKAVALYPEGRGDAASPQVEIEFTTPAEAGRKDFIPFDYLINATGPKLKFDATLGLGPDDGYSLSVCTAPTPTRPRRSSSRSSRPPAPAPAPAPWAVTPGKGKGAALANTGSDAMGLILAAGLLAGLGAVALRRRVG